MTVTISDLAGVTPQLRDLMPTLDVTAATALAGITATAGELNKLDGAGAVVASGTQHAHVADITTTATGTQISVAVNAVLAALEAFGINASA
jgi:hypothetical protein